jgi:hypothetical protein
MRDDLHSGADDEAPMPQPTPAATPPATRQGWPTWAKFLVGAGIGCFSLGVLAIVLLGVVAWWAITPGPQEPPPAFIGDDTVAVVATSSPGSDEGLNALMMQTISEFHRATWERMPEDEAPFFFRFVRGMQRRQIESGRAERKLAASMPRDIALLVVRRPDDAPTWLAVVNLAKGPRIYRLLFNFMAKRSGEIEAVTHRGETIVRLPDAPAFCFVDSTFLAADDVEVLKRAIDRQREPDADGTDLARRVGAMSSDWDIFGILDNTSGELSEEVRDAALFLERSGEDGFPTDLGDRELVEPASPDRWREVVEMELGIDVVDASTMKVVLDIAFDDSDAAVAMVPRLERMLESWAEAVEPSSLDVSSRIEQNGSTVRVIVDLQGVDEALVEGFETILDQAGAPSS